MTIQIKLTNYRKLKNSKNCIYKITNPNGNSYIGKTVSLHERISTYYSLECKQQRHLFNSLKYHGLNNHLLEVIEEDIPFDKLIEKEIYYIHFFDTFRNGMNFTLGGEGILKHTEDFCKILLEENRNGFTASELAKKHSINVNMVVKLIRRVGEYIKHKKPVDRDIVERIKEKNKKRFAIFGANNKGLYDYIPNIAKNELGVYLEVIPKCFSKDKRTVSEWHYCCNKLHTQNYNKQKRAII